MALLGRSSRFACSFAVALAAVVVLLALSASAHAARTVYFADPAADLIAGYAVGAGGALAPLDPASVAVHDPRRLAMTPDGRHLYATAKHGVAHFDVAADGRLTAGPPAPAGDEPHSIAVHPNGASVYVTDFERGKLRQFTVGADGRLAPRDPAYLWAGPAARGVAVDPSGSTAYVLTAGAIVVFDIGPDGALARRGEVELPSWFLEDLAFTPDGAHLYVTSSDGRLFSFDVGADRTPALADTFHVGAGLAPTGVAVAPDGSGVFVAAAGWPGAQNVLAFAVGADGALNPTSSAAIPGHKPLRYLSASPDGRSLFVAGGDGHLFDVSPGPLLAAKAPPSVDLHAAVGLVVSPNQAPVASFAAASGVAGAPAQFDAGSALDPDGTIVRYSWDFGDGTTLADGGPTPQHVYATPGTYTVTLVVTDNEGASTSTIFTGGTVLGNGAPGASARRLIEIAASPAPSAPPPAAGQELRPDLGQTLVAAPVAGSVRVQTPGTRRFVPLESITELPLGSVLDTRRGRVELATERAKRGGRVQEARFYGGLFQVRQRKRDRYVTELVLRGALAKCQGAGRARAAAASKRRVWGDGKGRFRTRGRYSSGAVRGTKWLTEDRCEGTLTLVRRGRVAVRDFTLDRTRLVSAGERYLARAP